MQYVVIDFYDDAEGEKVGEITRDIRTARQLKKQRIEDTDGECDVHIYSSDGKEIKR